MQFEVIKKNHKKEIIIGVIAFILIAIVFIVRYSFAKFETIKNIPIVEGTVNYKLPDFKIMAMYKNDGDNYTEIDTMPESGYEINKDKSYCTTDNINKVYNKVYTGTDGNHVITGLEKSSKCYLYFDKKLSAGETILGNVTVKDSPESFADVATTNEGVFKTQDDDGDTYYFRGAVENNYVKFANKYWRIIRINGDGSIRLIYDGETARANGTSSSATQIGTSAFNSSYTNNMYVGFKYTSGQVHGTGAKSTILGNLETWYNNNLSDYAGKIDSNAGFCNDREPSTNYVTSNGSGGTGTTTTVYGAYLRISPNGSYQNAHTPTFRCKNSSDLFTKSGATKGNKSLTYPIGLITADEVVYAGAHGSKPNLNYYLYTGQIYWTLSPSAYNGDNNYALIFYLNSKSNIGTDYAYRTIGVRPVINLRSDIELTGTGTMSDPYVVE